MLQTYGFAVLLMVVIGLLAGLSRPLMAGGEAGGQRQFVWKFAGVTLGAYVLHLFALLRSDLSPSRRAVLSPAVVPGGAAGLAWRCLRPGLGRGLLLLVLVALIADAAIAGRWNWSAMRSGRQCREEFAGGARGLSRGPRRRGPAARHRLPLLADPARTRRRPQRDSGLGRAGGARGAAARQAVGAPVELILPRPTIR